MGLCLAKLATSIIKKKSIIVITYSVLIIR